MSSETSSVSYIEVDGSQGEGGGQIVRTSFLLATLLEKPVKIKNIRGLRPNPGLQRQHLTGVNLVSKFCNPQESKLSGNFLKSTELEWIPKGFRVPSKDMSVEMGAGAVTLCAQISLPCYIFGFRGNETPFFECTLGLVGGTNVAFSPPCEKHAYVFLPILKNFFGIDIQFDILKRGFFPVGFGEVCATIKSVPKLPLKPIIMIERGFVEKIEVYAFSSGHYQKNDDPDPDSESNKMTQILQQVAKNIKKMLQKNEIKTKFSEKSKSKLVKAEETEELSENDAKSILKLVKNEQFGYEEAMCNCVSVTIVVSTSTGCKMSATQHFPQMEKEHSTKDEDKVEMEKNSKKKNKNFSKNKNWKMDKNEKNQKKQKKVLDVGEFVASLMKQFEDDCCGNICVDEFIQDQLLLFMALAQGKSQIRTSKPTLHSESQIQVLSLFTNAKFETKYEADSDTYIISCDGIGYC